jgi:hypothetical protein
VTFVLKRYFRLFCTLSVILCLGGCATLLDPWEQAGKIDFKTKGSLMGDVRLEGQDVRDWSVRIHARNVDTQEIIPIESWRNGFVVAVAPGNYRIHVTELHKISSNTSYSHDPKYSFSTITESRVPLGHQSQVYSIKPGEAVYVGDLHVWMGRFSDAAFKGGQTWAKWLTGITESNVQVAYRVSDNSSSKVNILEQKHPIKDYRFILEPLKFESLRI